MVFGILLRRHLLYFHGSVDDAEYQYGRSDVERVDYRVGDYAFGRNVAYADEREEEREYVSDQRAGVAEETLYGVGEAFLLLVYHVAHEHLEGLHGHVDACVEEHERHEAEHHCGRYCHAERACVGQHAHYEYGHQGSHEQVGYAPAEAAPCLVAERSHQRLYYYAH